jgi:hypothetical protein
MPGFSNFRPKVTGKINIGATMSSMDKSAAPGVLLTDTAVKQLNSDHEEQLQDENVLEGEVVDPDLVTSSPVIQPHGSETLEQELKSRIQSGEWDNLDDLPAFKVRTPEGQLMARTDAIDCRIRQLEQRLPMLLNQHLHDAYVQVLKKIHALRKTKAALFYYFYKHQGQRDLGSGK